MHCYERAATKFLWQNKLSFFSLSLTTKLSTNFFQLDSVQDILGYVTCVFICILNKLGNLTIMLRLQKSQL